MAKFRRRFPRFFLPASIALLLVDCVFCCFIWFTPDIEYSIATAEIRPEAGSAYEAKPAIRIRWLYSMPTDTMESPRSSSLLMFEDGQALGPAHSLHVDISDNGLGRYSHWNGSIIFSASDGTDPRVNGRIYSFKASTAVRPQLQYPLVGILAIANAAFLAFLIFLLRNRVALLFAALGALIVTLAALSAVGQLGRIVVARDGLPADAPLAFHALEHAVLGCLTSIGLWVAGAGISRLALRDSRAGLAQILIPAFPISLAVLAVLLATALVMPWGRLVAVAMWLACLMPLANWRPPQRQIINAVKAAVGIIPFAVAFGIWLALLWHGPTETLPGSPTGDLTFYVGTIWSLASHAFPQIDLGYAGGEVRGHFNTLYPALGAALLYLPHFDPFLFLLASGGTSYVLLTALMLHFYAAERVVRPITPPIFLLLTLSILVAARYPYWVAESIPMVFVPALTISVWWMAERSRQSFGWFLTAMLAGLSGSLLSKVVTAVVLVPLGSTRIWSRFRILPYALRLFVLGVGGMFAIYSTFMLFHFLPVFLEYATIGPESFRTPQWYFVCRDAGALLMVPLAWIIADLPVALALSGGLMTFLAFSWVFHANFVCVSIVLGLILVSDASSAVVRGLALATFALSLPALIFADPAGPSSGVIWIVCLGGAILFAILSAVGITGVAPQLTSRTSATAAIMTLMVTALGLVGVSRGSIIADSGWHFEERERLTPELKEIWSAVRQRTPQDTLIFTDQVDETEDTLGGWNTYSYSGQRQIYLSSHVTNLSLRKDAQKIRDLLSINKSVLDGSRRPDTVPTNLKYHAFFAVVSTSRAAPPGWRLIHANRRYALYEID